MHATLEAIKVGSLSLSLSLSLSHFRDIFYSSILICILSIVCIFRIDIDNDFRTDSVFHTYSNWDCCNIKYKSKLIFHVFVSKGLAQGSWKILDLSLKFNNL